MPDTITVKKLSMSYSGKKVLNELSFTVERGKVFGLLGANGAGKSTAIECILGTKRKDSGDITIIGLNPTSDRRQLFQRVGVQFQDSNYQHEIKVCELCEEIAGLYSKPANWKTLLTRFGISKQINNPVKNLSGGQRQRLFIVLALIPAPEVLFLDELTTGLDPRARRDVWKILKVLKQEGMTIVLTSHFMDEVEVLCDTIIILKEGETAYQGTVAEAIRQSPYEHFEDAYLWFSEAEREETIYEAI